MILLALACNTETNGTIVGNPGDAMVASAAPKGLSVVEGSFELDRLVLTSCSGDEANTITYEHPLVMYEDSLEMPGGSWCGLRMHEVWIELSLESEDELFVDLELSVEELDLGQQQVDIDENAFVLELTEEGWLDVDQLDLRDDLFIDEEHELHAELAAQFADASALYADDGDGELSEAERDAGPLSSGPDRGSVEEDSGGADADRDGGGCSAAPPGLGGLWLLLGVLGLRRRG